MTFLNDLIQQERLERIQQIEKWRIIESQIKITVKII